MWLAENPSHVRYRTNKENLAKFQGTFLQVLKKFKINHNTTRDEELDDSLSSLLTEGANIEKIVDEFNEALTMACNKTFQIHKASRNASSHRSIPWWSAALTVLRKRINVLRRLHQRTRNNEELAAGRETKIPR
jgi:paraquat-inducible protein B